jgi:hypothetical protein
LLKEMYLKSLIHAMKIRIAMTLMFATELKKKLDTYFNCNNDRFSLYSGINGYIPEHFQSYFTEKIWLRNYSQ